MPDRFASREDARAQTVGIRRHKGEGCGPEPHQRQEPSGFHAADERSVLVGVRPSRAGVETACQLEELHQLACTAGAQVVGQVTQSRARPHPRTYLGSGKLAELQTLCQESQATIVMADDDLTPAQVRNMEEILDLRVIDRSELIIDIFATHAGTRQSRLQVELAQLQYLSPRLKRMWTHLSRITGEGGIGSRGPGEKQIEVDRRIIQKRIRDLHRELREIEAHRSRQAKGRDAVFKVALVGYTNAGKSTLMQRLTGADVLIADKLFATLDTRTRRWGVAPDLSVLLSDTVGFIDKLPHHLVASFHATLEEVREADLLLHVVDAGDDALERRITCVHEVLANLGAGDIPELLVLNKCDVLEDPIEVTILARKHGAALAVSAKGGVGLPDLAERVAASARATFRQLELVIPVADGQALSLVARSGRILSRSFEDESCHLRVSLPAAECGRLRAQLQDYCAGAEDDREPGG